MLSIYTLSYIVGMRYWLVQKKRLTVRMETGVVSRFIFKGVMKRHAGGQSFSQFP